MTQPSATANDDALLSNLLNMIHPEGMFHLFVRRQDKKSFVALFPTEHQSVTAAKQEARKGRDIYVKIARFDGTTKTNNRPITTIDAALGCRTLFVDVDTTGSQQGYPDLQTAAAALEAARVAAKLPPWTFAQCSGSGLHAGYVLDQELNPADWKQAVLTLHKALKGLRHDESVGTIDKALRLCGPAFPNHKTNPPRITRLGIVASVQSWLRLKQTLTDATGGMIQLAARQGVLAEDYTTLSQLNIELVKDHCAVIHHTLKTGGKGYGRPAWIDTIALAAASVDGQRWAHELSRGHADYDPAEVDRTFESYHPGNRPVVRCRQLGRHAEFAPLCATCPHLNIVNTPQGITDILATHAHMARQLPPLPQPVPVPSPAVTALAPVVLTPTVAAAMAAAPKQLLAWALPEDFRNHHGQLERLIRGEWKVYAPFMLQSMRKFSNAMLGVLPLAVWEFDLVMPQARRVTAQINQEILYGDRRMFLSRMAEQGVALQQYVIHAKEALEYLTQEFPVSLELTMHTNTLGWTSKGVLVTDKIYTRHGPSRTARIFAATDNGLSDLASRGDAAEHEHLGKSLLGQDPRAEMHLMAAVAMAAPCVQLFSAHPAILSFTGVTGVGKTTMAEFASGLLRSPDIISFNGTSNAIMLAIAERRIFIAPIDEPDKIADPEILSNLLFAQTAHQMDKHRLNRNAKAQPITPFYGVPIFLSNMNMQQHINNILRPHPAGAVARIIEIPIIEAPPDSAMRFNLQRTYGHVLPVWSEWIARKYEYLQHSFKCHKRFFTSQYAKLGRGGDIRFYVDLAATVAATTRFMRWLKLHTKADLGAAKYIDCDKVETFLLTMPNAMVNYNTVVLWQSHPAAVAMTYLQIREGRLAYSDSNGKSIRKPKNQVQPACMDAICNTAEILIQKDVYDRWASSQANRDSYWKAHTSLNLPIRSHVIPGQIMPSECYVVALRRIPQHPSVVHRREVLDAVNRRGTHSSLQSKPTGRPVGS